ncbi:MAG: VCBS repeat-containing protein [Calothrix sp. SM1_7_51]|nr:VCBS repeat-containing protein [Calothrix sp. SM1_7_51]
MVSSGDFNGDSKADILWRRKTDGENAIWLDGFQLLNSTSGRTITKQPDTNWQIITAKDFNGDGKSDILWRNNVTGENAIWFMDSFTVDGQFLEKVPDKSWKIVGAGDIDDDGKADIIWRHENSGENAVWLMDGKRLKDGKFITPLADKNWKIEAIGDLNGDGQDDIVWRNKITDESAVWFVDTTKLVNNKFFVDGKLIANQNSDTPKPGLNWKLEAVADYNGDGKDDMLWRNYTTGENALWWMNGSVIAESGFISQGDSILKNDVKWEIIG